MNPARLLFRFFVPGVPVAKGRARATVRRGRGGKVIMTKQGQPIIGNYTPAATRNFEAVVKDLALAAIGGPDVQPISEPIDLLVEFRFPIPESWPPWKRQAAADGRLCHTSKPDCSNLVKAIEDACNKVLFVDDGQIVGSAQDKLYTTGAPCVLVAGYRRAAVGNHARKADLASIADMADADRIPVTRRLLSNQACQIVGSQ